MPSMSVTVCVKSVSPAGMELRSQERSYWRHYPLSCLPLAEPCAARGATALHGQGAQGHRARRGHTDRGADPERPHTARYPPSPLHN